MARSLVEAVLFAAPPGGAVLAAPDGAQTRARRFAVVASVLLVAATGVGTRADVVGPPSTATRPAPVPDAAAEARRQGIDVDAVVADASRRVMPDPRTDGALVATDRAYRASFDALGFAVATTTGGLDLRVTTSALRRGERSLPVRPSAWRSDGDVASRRLGPGTSERVAVRDGEVEWDVVLDRAPGGMGDLVLEAALGGHAGAPRLRGGTWRWRAGGDRLRMDELVVVDARGTELSRAVPAIDGDRLSLRVPAAVLDEAQYPLTLDPTISAEADVSTRLVPHEEPSAVGFDGTNFLVVWHNAPVFPNEGGDDIYGTRVAADGTILDPEGIQISTALNMQSNPSVAFDGTNYLVVWDDSRSGPCCASFDIYGARVTTAGVVLDGGPTAGIPIQTAGDPQRLPDVAWSGTRYLVAYQCQCSGQGTGSQRDDIYGNRVLADGTVLDGGGIQIATNSGPQRTPAVASDGTNFAIVWRDNTNNSFFSDIQGAVYDPDGVEIIRGPVSTAVNDQLEPDVAWDGTRYLAVWEDHRACGASSCAALLYDIYGTRLGADLNNVDPAGIGIQTASNIQSIPAVVVDGTNFLVTWQSRVVNQPADIAGARVDGTGAVVDANEIVISSAANDQRAPAAASAGAGGAFVVWGDLRTSRDVYGARVDTSGAVQDGGATGGLLVTAASQSSPAVAWDGTNFLVVWQVGPATSADVYGTRVNASGVRLGATFPIGRATGTQTDPAVAWNGSTYLVVWTDSRGGGSDVYGARVTAAGVVSDPTGIPVAAGTAAEQDPAVAASGATFLVVWQDARTDAGDVFGARVDGGTGAVVDSGGFGVSTFTSTESAPAVAGNGTDFLVVWQDDRSGTSSDVYGARVTGSGIVLDPTVPVTGGGVAIAQGPFEQVVPSLAWNAPGSRYLVVWAQIAGGESDVRATRVTTTTGITVTDTNPLGISSAPVGTQQRTPVVAVSSNLFLVVWKEERQGRVDVVGRRVKNDGTFTEVDTTIDQTGTAFGVAVAPAATDGKWRVAYDRLFGDEHRAFTRRFSK